MLMIGKAFGEKQFAGVFPRRIVRKIFQFS